MEAMMNDAFGHYRQQVSSEGVSELCGVDEILNEGPKKGHSFIDEFLKDENHKFYHVTLRPFYNRQKNIIRIFASRVNMKDENEDVENESNIHAI
ncbi:hypothetical protein Lal_00028581 [Lupinus albus]|nr:hypothetical protein Lal_00028581 [Lupinus albus]